MDKFEERYHVKRAAGISSTRGDGSARTPGTDKQSGHAEEYAAQMLGSVVDDSITVTGDRGYDFPITVELPSGRQGRLRVEAIWNGFETGSTSRPRLFGNLIINPDDEHRYRNTDIFVLVVGTVEHGFELMGWATWADVKSRPTKSFGYGRKYYVPMHELRKMDRLKVAINA